MLQFILFEHPAFAATGLLYAISMALLRRDLVHAQQDRRAAATASMLVAVLVNAGLFADMWVHADRAPLKSLFETAIFLALNIGFLYLVMERLYRTRVFGVVAGGLRRGEHRLRAHEVGRRDRRSSRRRSSRPGSSRTSGSTSSATPRSPSRRASR